jgi:hypothetical protein
VEVSRAPGDDVELTIKDAAVRLGRNAGAFGALVLGVSEEQARWKPEPGQWSVLEVVNHLADEEAEDFRRRLELTLLRPGEPWPGIDPQGWVVSRGYNERELPASLRRFLDERERSIAWLAGLPEDADLARAYEHPSLGQIRAGDLLASWVAHDLIHIRQLTRLHYRWLERVAGGATPPQRLDYAGPF